MRREREEKALPTIVLKYKYKHPFLEREREIERGELLIDIYLCDWTQIFETK